MIRGFILLFLCLVYSTSTLADGPEDVLDAYFEIVISQNYDHLADLMDADEMVALKALMVNVVRKQMKHGRYDLQKRIFGKKVTLKKVKETSAEFYLRRLAKEILVAANREKFTVSGRKLLGRIDESPGQVHFLVRMKMSQNGASTTALRVYTMVQDNGVWKMKFPELILQMLQIIEVGDSVRPR